MGIKNYKPTTPSLRFTSGLEHEEITRSEPLRSLTVGLPSTGGRDANGRMSVRRRGGGHKRRYRVIDFRRDKHSVPASVAAIEYDPNRSANIALVHYADGEKRYILAAVGVSVGDELISGPDSPIRPGNAMPLGKMPGGTPVHNVELKQGKGGEMVRSAGASAQLVSREAGMARLRLPSGEVRLVADACMATVGQVGNVEHDDINLGKAGRSRWLGRRPKVRGVAMNPVDHPMGGGEGKSSGGRHPCTPWGKPTKGYRTRRNRRTQRFIVKRRGKK